MHARISPKRLIIAAASARPFVRAAVAAGYEVIAADVFCDTDTCRDAFMAIPLPYAQGGFDPAVFRVEVFPLLQASEAAFVYGSGFEAQPALLDEVAQRCQVMGNQARTVDILKDPSCFFSLLQRLAIPHPTYSIARPMPAEGWLCKRVGGSGGTHVHHATAAAEGEHYYQRQWPGKPVSLLFLADGQQVRVVGFNAQLLAPTQAMPYRFGGAVSQVQLPTTVRDGMREAAEKITLELGLCGLNSLDCMVDGDRFWVLEVNPRLSATFALYDATHQGARLFQAHLRACLGELPASLPPEQARAHLIYYAPVDLTIPGGASWPEWVADVPSDASCIRTDEPMCTVMASADHAEAAEVLARQRIAQLTQRINQFREL